MADNDNNAEIVENANSEEPSRLAEFFDELTNIVQNPKWDEFVKAYESPEQVRKFIIEVTRFVNQARWDDVFNSLQILDDVSKLVRRPDAYFETFRIFTKLVEFVQEPTWDDFFDEFHEKITPVNEQRRQLHKDVVGAIRRLEKKLQAALAGQPLKGSYNIFTSTMPLNAWNVRRQNKSDVLRFPKHEEHEPQALVLLPDGCFAIAKVESTRRVERGFERHIYGWKLYEPLDEDFRVEDLQHCLETVVHACQRHLFKSAGVEGTTAKMRILTDAIIDTMMKI